MLHRNNTLVPGGLLYKDDPTVLAWELQNEPQLREGFELCAAPRPAEHASHRTLTRSACHVGSK